MFPQADGRPQNRKAVWRAFDRTIKKANENVVAENEKLRRLTIHALRHTFAPIHLMQGTPITEVSAMLGHADVTTTLRLFSLHPEDENRFDSALCCRHLRLK
jgi:integrase